MEAARQPRGPGPHRTPFSPARRPGRPGSRRIADYRHRILDRSLVQLNEGWPANDNVTGLYQ